MKKAPSRLLFPVRRHRKPASPDQRRGRFFRFFRLFAPLFLSVSLLFRRTADAYYTTTRNIRELQRHHNHTWRQRIIPQQETSGNYNDVLVAVHGAAIIPQQETSGNYNLYQAWYSADALYHNKKHQGTTTVTVCMECDRDYTTTRNIRELQQIVRVFVSWQYYTTTRNIRELQRGCPRLLMLTDYTTTRNIRELQPEMFCYPSVHHYTTTRNIRELQRLTSVCPP